MTHFYQCGSCRASIFWARSATTGRPMPIDRDPVVGGNIEIIDDIAHVREPDLFAVAGTRYIAHFATCPNAKQHRRGKR